MLFANGKPIRQNGLGVIDFECEGNVCNATSTSGRDMIRALQIELNRFVGLALKSPIRSDGGIGPDTVQAILNIAYVLAATGKIDEMYTQVLGANKYTGNYGAAWVASRVEPLLTNTRRLANTLGRPSALAAIQQTEPMPVHIVTAALTPRGPRRWPWIVGGLAVLTVGGFAMWLALRKRRN